MIAIGAAALSVLAVFIVRRLVPLTVLQSHHEFGGLVFSVLGLTYGVLLGFVVLVVWGDYKDAKANVTLEANELRDLAQLARGFDPATAATIEHALAHYVRIAINDEWPAMARNSSSKATSQAFDRIWLLYTRLERKDPRELVLYGESLDRLGTLSDARRMRLHAAVDTIHPMIWSLLLFGGFLMVAFTYFFAPRLIISQAIMTGVLAIQMVLLLALIAALDRPFSGPLQIPPSELTQILTR